MNLNDLLQRHPADVAPEVIDFATYYERVQADPSIAQLSHARMYAMLTENSSTGTDFFKDIIFGAQPSIEKFTSVLKSASKRMEIRKRIILFMGPPGAGKSTLVAALKKGLASYTKRHPLYAIADCPIQEEPLHLLPESSRADLAEQGVYVEGGLCPYCQKVVQEEYAGKIGSVPVRKITLSESERRGIGTFAASDSKNQSIDDLVGAIDLSKLTQYAEHDPRAYSFNGEILIANRGALELIEIFKANQELLWAFLDVTQEQQVKLPRLPMCHVDEVILAHTNQAEFDKFMADPKNEALRDRIVFVRVPYTLAVSDEVRIYERLLAHRALDTVHVPEMSLRVAAQFAILTRLTDSDRLKTSDENKSGLVKKMKLYNGERQIGFTASDIKALHEESPEEGMQGAGPRHVINALSVGLVKNDATCLTPVSTLRTLSEMIKGDDQLSDQRKALFNERLSIVVEMFTEESKVEVQKAFTHGFGDAAADMFQRYIDNVGAFLNDEKIENKITGNEEPANERLMRRIEEMIGIGENQAKTFRNEVFNKLGDAVRRGRAFDYTSHPLLKEGIEKALFHDLKDAIAITTGQKQNPDSQRRFNEVVISMKQNGWCEVCAGELIEFVAQRLV